MSALFILWSFVVTCMIQTIKIKVRTKRRKEAVLEGFVCLSLSVLLVCLLYRLGSSLPFSVFFVVVFVFFVVVVVCFFLFFFLFCFFVLLCLLVCFLFLVSMPALRALLLCGSSSVIMSFWVPCFCSQQLGCRSPSQELHGRLCSLLYSSCGDSVCLLHSRALFIAIVGFSFLCRRCDVMMKLRRCWVPSLGFLFSCILAVVDLFELVVCLCLRCDNELSFLCGGPGRALCCVTLFASFFVGWLIDCFWLSDSSLCRFLSCDLCCFFCFVFSAPGFSCIIALTVSSNSKIRLGIFGYLFLLFILQYIGVAFWDIDSSASFLIFGWELIIPVLIYHFVNRIYPLRRLPASQPLVVSLMMTAIIGLAASYFFQHDSYKKSVSPRLSRLQNDPCNEFFIPAFYADTHDLWHLLSCLDILFFGLCLFESSIVRAHPFFGCCHSKCVDKYVSNLFLFLFLLFVLFTFSWDHSHWNLMWVTYLRELGFLSLVEHKSLERTWMTMWERSTQGKERTRGKESLIVFLFVAFWFACFISGCILVPMISIQTCPWPSYAELLSSHKLFFFRNHSFSTVPLFVYFSLFFSLCPLCTWAPAFSLSFDLTSLVIARYSTSQSSRTLFSVSCKLSCTWHGQSL